MDLRSKTLDFPDLLRSWSYFCSDWPSAPGVAFLICNSEQRTDLAITLCFGALGLVLQTGAIHKIHTHAGAEVVMQHARQSKALGIRVTESAAVRLTSSSVLNAHCNETSVLSHPPESAGHSFSGETAQRPPRLTGPPDRNGKKARAANCSRYGNHKNH